MARRRTKSIAEASNSPPPTAIARATRSRKSLALPSVLETQQPLPMASEQGSIGQRRSSRSAPKRSEGLAPSPTTGVSPMVTRGKQAKDENDGRDKDHEDEAPRDQWRSPENSTKHTATPPPIPDSRDDDEESLIDEADKKDEEHLDEHRQDNDYGHGDENEGNVLLDPLSTNSSPDGQGSYTSSLNGGDRMSSPSASRHYDAASAKRRRKKTRNPHISPNKQRQLRQKQKEREEKRKGDVASSPVSTAGSGSGALPHFPHLPVPVTTEGIPTPASPLPSIAPPKVNRAFEEDFGPFLNSNTNTQEASERVDTPVDASSVDAAAAFLIGTAMGGFSEDESAELVTRDSSVEAEQDEDMPDVPAQSDASLLNVAANSNIIAESPSNQLLAELQKIGDDATEGTLSCQASPIMAGVSTPATTVNGVMESRRALCMSGESSSRSQASPVQGLECSRTSDAPEKDILNISFGRRLSLGPSHAGISESNNVNTADSTIKENNTQSRECNTRLVVRDGPPTPKLDRRDSEIVVGGTASPTKITSPRERIEIKVQLEDHDLNSGTTDEVKAAASVLSQMLNQNNLISTIGRKRSHSELSLRGGRNSPRPQSPSKESSCPTCPITAEQISACLEKMNVGANRMSLEVFMDKHRELCAKNVHDESLVSEGEMEDEDEYGDYGEEEEDGEEGDAAEELGGELVGADEDSAVDGGEELMEEEDEGVVQKTAPTASGMGAALRKMAESLPGYLSIKPEDIDKEIEIRRSAIANGQLSEGTSVEDILFIPITPISTFQQHLENSKTTAEKFLVEEKIVEALADMQVEYLMIDEIVKRKEASTPDGEGVAITKPTRGRKKRKLRVVRNPLEPEDPIVWEDKKEAELYGFSYDPAIDKRGKQNADEQQAGKYSIRGRELRSRQKAVEMVLYPGYEHVDQRVQTIQPKATRRRKPVADKGGNGELPEELRPVSATPPVSAAPKKRPGRPPKNAPPALFLSVTAKDQVSAQALSRTHSADNVVRPRVGTKPKVDPNRTPPCSISGTLENSIMSRIVRMQFRGARVAEYLNIVSQEPNLSRRNLYSPPAPSSSAPTVTQSEPVSPTKFYADKHTRQSDSFMSFVNGATKGQRSESPVYDSAESNDGVGRGKPRSRGRGRARGRARGARRPGRPGRGSGLRVETSSAANSVGRGEPLSANPETPTLSAVEYSEAEDAAINAPFDRGHNYHSNGFQSLSKTAGSVKRSAPAVMHFNSTPSPLFTVFPSRSGPHPLPTSTSPTYHDNRSSAETDHGKPRVRGKTYKTPTSVSMTEAQPKTTKEEEFIAAQNGNLGKRKRVKTALAYEAPRRKARAVTGRDGAVGSGHSPGSMSGERDETESSEPDDDDSGGYGNER
ncbi:hypothetical protein L873DRAFT_1116904 [Choiromyces venosus 120613-1]|uniref:Uncharacterized protein n=1 Tax=Choiromyces venosus 120613-1 TaxID=1336337 RepID=A0A3N4JL12_9PEZI|nr:hypothetical protein L873DRAFT_1116904 [Choiromyces venosus 120613-1]